MIILYKMFGAICWVFFIITWPFWLIVGLPRGLKQFMIRSILD